MLDSKKLTLGIVDEVLTNSPILDPISEFKELLGNEFDAVELQRLSPKI